MCNLVFLVLPITFRLRCPFAFSVPLGFGLLGAVFPKLGRVPAKVPIDNGQFGKVLDLFFGALYFDLKLCNPRGLLVEQVGGGNIVWMRLFLKRGPSS
jgi:hypothetical protein